MKRTSDSIMNMLPCGYLSTNEEGKITFINKYLLNLLAVEENEVIGKKPLQDFFPVGVKIYFETHIGPLLLMQGTVEEISIELIRSDHTRIPVLLNAVLEKKSEHGQAIIYYTFFDISQRKKYEQELLLATRKQKKLLLQVQERSLQIQKDNAYYKSIIENQSFYIIKTDLEGNYTYLNPAYCKVMGIRHQDWLGKSALTLVIPEDHSRCQEIIELCFAYPDKSHLAIIRMQSPEGILTTQWEFSLLCEDPLNCEAFLGIGHDITPLIKKQEDLQRLVDVTALQNKRLNNFTYIVSHNIRSHVANLSGILNITNMNDAEDRNLSFSILKKSVGALDETIHHLNDVISIQDNTNLPKSVLNVKNEINKALENIKMLLLSSNTSVHCDVPDQQQLITNSAYFESILLNLLTNAVKYRSPKRNPDITISLLEEENYKILIVTDNGLGIDLNKYRNRLFGMYNTFHGNKDAKGLGLFITKTQIESMKGKIEVESTLDVGTTFKVYFPLN